MFTLEGRRKVVKADPPGDLSFDEVLTAGFTLRLLDLGLLRREGDDSDPPEVS